MSFRDWLHFYDSLTREDHMPEPKGKVGKPPVLPRKPPALLPLDEQTIHPKTPSMHTPKRKEAQENVKQSAKRTKSKSCGFLLLLFLLLLCLLP
jgi:hypothetical protein